MRNLLIIVFSLTLATFWLACAPIYQEHEVEIQKEEGVEYPRYYTSPFCGGNIIEFEVTDSAKVKFEIFNVSDKLMQTNYDEILEPKMYRASFGSGLASGIYFYKITSVSIPDGDTTVVTKKMVLLK